MLYIYWKALGFVTLQRMYKIDVLFWSESDNNRTPSFSIQVHLPVQWTPRLLIAAIWESVVGEHCITILKTPNPLDQRITRMDITTVNNISFLFVKNAEVLKCQLEFGLACVSGGYR